MEPADDIRAIAALREQAVELLILTQSDTGVDARARLNEWRNRSSAHKLALEEAEKVWQRLGTLPAPRLSLAETLRLSVSARLASARDYPLTAARRSAAVGAVLLGALFFSQSAVFNNMRAGASGSAEGFSPVVHHAMERGRYETQRGELRRVALADGSELTLDWSSSVDVRFSKTRRQITLHRGKAIFSVAKDTARPFVVSASGVEAIALGTEFVVHRVDYETVEVSVREGKVGVAGPSNRTTESIAALEAEETLRVVKGAEIRRGYRATSEIGTWVEGVLVFEDRSLGDALTALEPYLGYRLDASRLVNTEQSVSGTFVTHRAGEALSVLMQTYGFEAGRQRGQWLELQPVQDVRADQL